MAHMMTTNAPRGRGVFWHAYVGTWATLAIVASGYLGLSFTRPELVATFVEPVAASPRTADKSASAIPTRVDLMKLRVEVDDLRSDIAQVRATVEQQGPAIERIASSLDGLRQGQAERLASVAPHTPPPPAPVAATVASKVESAAPELRETTDDTAPPRSRVVTGSIPPLPTRAPPSPRGRFAETAITSAVKQNGRLATLPSQPRMLNQPPAGDDIRFGGAPESNPANQVTTGSLPRAGLTSPQSEPVIRFGAPVVTTAAPPPAVTASGGTALRLSSGNSLASLRISWQVLRQLHNAELGDLEGRYRVQGATYQLLAGPFADRRQADSVCSELRSKNVSCSIDEFGGNAL